MRIKAKDPRLVSLMGEFMRIYLPGVRIAIKTQLTRTDIA